MEIGSLEWLLSFTEPNGECLEWTRCFNTDGYPRRGVKGNSNIKVHREVFKLANGFEPPLVRHSCDNIKCIRPEHLLEGDPTSNMVDRQERGRTFKQVTDEEIFWVTRLLNKGMTQVEISKALGASVKRINYIVSRKVGQEV